ncbi:MAG: anaerobic ribonucleoside-triphosphate reductase, partial [Promethearchaeia archaeon]
MNENNESKTMNRSYLIKLLPRVNQTEGDVSEFKPSKIKKSLIKEANLSKEGAERITELVVRRIISSGMEFLSGPHIREIVCSVLSEQHFEEERKLYTRIGMPLMDYDELLKNPRKQRDFLSMNPESIHHWAANRISEEYALLRLLNGEESKAHLYGDIHIHNLRYFDLRPCTQMWDPRMILKNGLPPTSNWSHCNQSGSAGNFKVAIAQLAKWLGMTQGEFCGKQGFDLFTIFLAPYITDLPEKEIVQGVQSLIFEIGQLAMIIGRQIPDISVSTSAQIFQEIADLPAIGPYGKKSGTYGDYTSECETLFEAFIEVFIEGDYSSTPFTNPKHVIYYTPDQLTPNSLYSQIWNEIKNATSPYLKNFNQNTPLLEIIQKAEYFNYGTLQNVSINLPRLTYKSHSETEFFKLLHEVINLSANILLKKYEIINQRLNSNHLPLCSGMINGSNLLNLETQNLGISLIGLNKAIRTLTGSSGWDDESAFLLGKKIVTEVSDTCKRLSNQHNKHFSLIENFSKQINHRFLKLDIRHFPKKLNSFIKDEIQGAREGYLNSARLKKILNSKNEQLLRTQAVLSAPILDSLTSIKIHSKSGFN